MVVIGVVSFRFVSFVLCCVGGVFANTFCSSCSCTVTPLLWAQYYVVSLATETRRRGYVTVVFLVCFACNACYDDKTVLLLLVLLL